MYLVLCRIVLYTGADSRRAGLCTVITMKLGINKVLNATFSHIIVWQPLYRHFAIDVLVRVHIGRKPLSALMFIYPPNLLWKSPLSAYNGAIGSIIIALR